MNLLIAGLYYGFAFLHSASRPGVGSQISVQTTIKMVYDVESARPLFLLHYLRLHCVWADILIKDV